MMTAFAPNRKWRRHPERNHAASDALDRHPVQGATRTHAKCEVTTVPRKMEFRWSGKPIMNFGDGVWPLTKAKALK